MVDSLHRVEASPAPSRLSPRELDVLELASRGLTNVEIGRRLCLSVHGVKFHLASIYRKQGVSNRTEAATMFLRMTDGLHGVDV